ncbi:MAG: hypothetical protein ACJ0CN_02910 [Candidatus Poseidoniaceae archaeon]
MSTMVEKSLSSQSVSILPILLLGFLHVIITPLREVFKIEPLLMIPYYLTGVLIGIFIYRKSNTVKDYEYRRSKVMKKMKKTYAAEESGVWQTNAEISDRLDESTNLARNVSQISTESPEMELSDENKVDVDMLNESKTIIEATRRVSGKSTFDEQEITATIGATRKTSPMDKFLDFFSGLFRSNSSSESREEKRMAALTAASEAAPVKAVKPQAPIQYERNEVSIEPDSEVSYSENVESESSDIPEQSNPQNNPTPVGKNYSAFAPLNTGNNSTQSIESMAMLPNSNQQTFTAPASIQQPRCRGCNYPVKSGDRFCDNCGLDVI